MMTNGSARTFTAALIPCVVGLDFLRVLRRSRTSCPIQPSETSKDRRSRRLRTPDLHLRNRVPPPAERGGVGQSDYTTALDLKNKSIGLTRSDILSSLYRKFCLLTLSATSPVCPPTFSNGLVNPSLGSLGPSSVSSLDTVVHRTSSPP